MKILDYEGYLKEHRRELIKGIKRWKTYTVLMCIGIGLVFAAMIVCIVYDHWRLVVAESIAILTAMISVKWGFLATVRDWENDLRQLDIPAITRAVERQAYLDAMRGGLSYHEEQLDKYVAESRIVAVVDPVEVEG